MTACPEPVRARIQELDSGQLCISVVSEAEVADFLRRLHFRRVDGLKVENWA